MDQFTKDHLAHWLQTEFGNIAPTRFDSLEAAMIKIYETDPEFYSNNSWWVCYDQAGNPDSWR